MFESWQRIQESSGACPKFSFLSVTIHPISCLLFSPPAAPPFSLQHPRLSVNARSELLNEEIRDFVQSVVLQPEMDRVQLRIYCSNPGRELLADLWPIGKLTCRESYSNNSIKHHALTHNRAQARTILRKVRIKSRLFVCAYTHPLMQTIFTTVIFYYYIFNIFYHRWSKSTWRTTIRRCCRR